jgi:hypothetical protein
MRLTASDRVGLEIKAPKALQWPARSPDVPAIRHVIDRALRGSRGQISREDPGMLGLVSTAMFVDTFKSAIQETLCGAKPRSISCAAVCYMAPVHLSFERGQSDLLAKRLWRVEPVINPHYYRDNPIRTSAPPRAGAVAGREVWTETR